MLTLNAISGPLSITLQWTGADPVHLFYSRNRNCDWPNYPLCNGSGMVPNASGGQHVLTTDNDVLEPDRDYHFVAEANGSVRSFRVCARAIDSFPIMPLTMHGKSWT